MSVITRFLSNINNNDNNYDENNYDDNYDDDDDDNNDNNNNDDDDDDDDDNDSIMSTSNNSILTQRTSGEFPGRKCRLTESITCQYAIKSINIPGWKQFTSQTIKKISPAHLFS